MEKVAKSAKKLDNINMLLEIYDQMNIDDDVDAEEDADENLSDTEDDELEEDEEEEEEEDGIE